MALATGHVDVDGMLDGMSSRAWSEWLVFWRLFGFGERRMDVRFAELMALVANLARSKDADPVPVEAFLPGDEGDMDLADADVTDVTSADDEAFQTLYDVAVGG